MERRLRSVSVEEVSKVQNRSLFGRSGRPALRVVQLAVVVWSLSLADADAPRTAEGTASLGTELFLAQGCAACHALESVGARGLFAPPLDGVATTALERIASPDYRGAANDVGGYLRESIVTPTAYVVPGYAGSYHRMPAYLHLTDAELDALIALLASSAPEGRETEP
ncbi:MAG: cytochrome c [Trueperaceae bacterium]